MKPKVFIDGSEGTTGLQIHDRLAPRSDIEILKIGEAKRKDTAERKKLINSADIVFLCLPDEAAREAVALIENGNTRVIDASTAHRVSKGWVYGLPELSKTQKADIRKARRVSNPGCHATGAVMLLYPLMKAGIIPDSQELAITSVTGYTGGGKSMIQNYEEERGPASELNAPRLYGITARHKHIPEIMKHTGLKRIPAFLPIVADYPQGMQVAIPLHLPGKRRAVLSTLRRHYKDCKNCYVTDSSPILASSNVNADTDKITIKVLGFDDMIYLTAQFDNLGKGAAGAAVQNMNIMLGFEEYEGLAI